ncbi:MAG: TSUP family transporter [Bacteroidales bacterium]|nr:TSUP family transporter [Bacteroidales bacterium]
MGYNCLNKKQLFGNYSYFFGSICDSHSYILLRIWTWNNLNAGFFGGLRGIQGAIRRAFLIKSGLTKEAYIATGVVIACLVDLTRLSVYTSRFKEANLHEYLILIIFATLAAIAGAFIGSKLLKKITLRFIQVLVAVMLVVIPLALGAGII